MAGLGSIDDVIDALGAIVDDARVRGDRRGLFVALYRRTTIAVKNGIDAGRFDDPERMEELDVRFAGRYFDAWEAHETGSQPSQPWAYAFQRAADPDVAILQHLLLGVNAHISLDLAISACDTCPGPELPALKRDFFEINRLLADMVDHVQEDLNQTSPLLARIDRWGGPVDERLAAAFLARARGAAWRKALRFAAAAPDERPVLIDRWERQVERISHRICPPPERRWHPTRAVAQSFGGTRSEEIPGLLDLIA